MFPFVYGFEWNPGYLIFLGVFFTVAMVVVATMAMAGWRSMRDLRQGRQDEVRWQAVFHELPADERSCRHAMTGELPGRECEQGFACGRCQMHLKLAEVCPPPTAQNDEVLGMRVPMDRYYHRGHTWVRPEEDGTLSIGLDEMGRRLIGPPDLLELPPVGAGIRQNSPLVRMRKKGVEVQVMAPVGGTVTSVAEPGEDWWLRVRPTPGEGLAHLLRGAEVSAWYRRELERLQLAMGLPDGAPSLADGGVLVDDLSEVCPRRQWDAVCGDLFLDV